MARDELGLIMGILFGERYYIPYGMLPPVGSSNFDSEANQYIAAQDTFYDPYHQDEDDVWGDPYVPPDETEEYPEVPFLTNREFSIFSVVTACMEETTLASYPYQRTENGDPLFRYYMTPSDEGTDFIVQDNLGSFTVHVYEPLCGRFCVKMTLKGGLMTIKIWGDITTEAYEIAKISSRSVTFDYNKIAVVS